MSSGSEGEIKEDPPGRSEGCKTAGAGRVFAAVVLLVFRETGKQCRVLIRSADMFTEAEEQSGVEGKLPSSFFFLKCSSVFEKEK